MEVQLLKVKNLYIKITEKILDFDRKSDKNKKILYYSAYTFIFVIMVLCVYFWFWYNRKSFIWHMDGLTQNYNSLIYFGRYLREAASGILSGDFSLPMWDFSIGYGSDILTTLNYYVIGDPLNLLAVFFSPEKTEYLYMGLIVFRLFLAGISFSAFCAYKKRKRIPTLAGVFIYIFCGFSLFSAVRHPYFINPMIYLPLLLLGVDKIFENKKPWLFIGMAALSAVSNFYFLYMLTLLSVMYAAFRFFMIFKERRVRNFSRQLFKFSGFYVTGIMLAAVTFLPVVIEFLKNPRLDSGYSDSLLFYDLSYYSRFIGNYISCTTLDYWSATGYAPTVLLCIVLLFTKRSKQNLPLQIGFGVLTLFLLVPFFGFMFNGFAYIANRWVFGYSLLLAYIAATVLPEFADLCRGRKIALICTAITVGLLCFFVPVLSNEKYYASFGLLAVTVMLILGLFPILKDFKGYKQLSAGVILALTLSGVICNAFYKFSFTEGDYISEFKRIGSSAKTLANTPALALKEIQDNSFYRVDQPETIYNDALYQQFYGTTGYYSITNGNVTKYYKELFVPLTTLNIFDGLDSRAGLTALAGVKYCAVEEGKEANVPYGFTKAASTVSNFNGEHTFILYQNKNSLPLGYTYASYITVDEFSALPPEKKQQAMLQSIVVDGEIEGFDKGRPVFDDKKLPYTLEGEDGITIDNNVIAVTKENAALTLYFEGEGNAETYLILENLKYHGINPLNLKLEALSGKSPYQINKLKNAYRYWKEPTSLQVKVSSEFLTKSVTVRTPKDSFYGNIHDYLINLGYSKGAQNFCKIKFPKPGNYTFDDLRIVCQPMDNFSGQVEELSQDVMEDITLKDNFISGKVSLSEDKILCLPIPFHAGWTAKVNGQEVKLIKSNVMYSAIQLKAGENRIELKYKTPGLKYGFAVSLATLLLLAAVVLITRKRTRPAR